jgi:hypothetical protein
LCQLRIGREVELTAVQCALRERDQSARSVYSKIIEHRIDVRIVVFQLETDFQITSPALTLVALALYLGAYALARERRDQGESL